MWTVDIDVGGTLTDGIFTRGDQVVCVKVDSTPHDLTLCLFDCLTQGAAQLGFAEALDLLEHVELIRWSTTITSNVLAEQRGPRIGLLVTRGHEKDLYARQASSAVLNRLLAEGDVIGLNGSQDPIVVMNAVRSLLENGVRRICVSLQGSADYREREAAIKRIVDQQYPDHFLGSVPVLAGSDMSLAADDNTRTCYALINAYTHGALAATLFKAEDELRETHHYSGAFLVSHINGGVAGLYKTKAVDTIESGPILGLHASAYLARNYGLGEVIALDVGGTTAKVGVLRKAEPITRKPSDFFGISVNVALPYLRSIALGGGSVVQACNREGVREVQLGPASMGSFPGPACYALGGDQATLTDAFVCAGLIDPAYFLGGAKTLDAELARKTIDQLVAAPAHASTADACRAIIDRAFAMVADLVSEVQSELRYDLSRHALFAYGGNGGLFACGVAEKLGINAVYLFALGPVFSAFGSSVSDISHLYERSVAGIPVSADGIASMRNIVRELKAESVQDLLGEAISPDDVTFTVEFELSDAKGSSLSASCAELTLSTPGELQVAVETALAAAGSAEGRVFHFDLVRLRARKAMPKPHLNRRSLQSADPGRAKAGVRQVAWGGGSQAQVYRWELLQPGNQVAGPAILEGAQTTYFIPHNWVATLDDLGNAVARHAQQVQG